MTTARRNKRLTFWLLEILDIVWAVTLSSWFAGSTSLCNSIRNQCEISVSELKSIFLQLINIAMCVMIALPWQHWWLSWWWCYHSNTGECHGNIGGCHSDAFTLGSTNGCHVTIVTGECHGNMGVIVMVVVSPRQHLGVVMAIPAIVTTMVSLWQCWQLSWWWRLCCGCYGWPYSILDRIPGAKPLF